MWVQLLQPASSFLSSEAGERQEFRSQHLAWDLKCAWNIMAAPSFLEIPQSLLLNNHPRMEIHDFGNLNCGGKKA
jgi:hypothetical protein